MSDHQITHRDVSHLDPNSQGEVEDGQLKSESLEVSMGSAYIPVRNYLPKPHNQLYCTYIILKIQYKHHQKALKWKQGPFNWSVSLKVEKAEKKKEEVNYRTSPTLDWPPLQQETNKSTSAISWEKKMEHAFHTLTKAIHFKTNKKVSLLNWEQDSLHQNLTSFYLPFQIQFRIN